jgi:hypothetical protein
MSMMDTAFVAEYWHSPVKDYLTERKQLLVK